jgi:hypothetical protein
MINLLDYDPGEGGTAWQLAIDQGAWSQEDFDFAVERLRTLRLDELGTVARDMAEKINPVLGNTVAIEIFKMLQPVLDQQRLTTELQQAIGVLGKYGALKLDVDTMPAVDLYAYDALGEWNE